MSVARLLRRQRRAAAPSQRRRCAVVGCDVLRPFAWSPFCDDHAGVASAFAPIRLCAVADCRDPATWGYVCSRHVITAVEGAG